MKLFPAAMLFQVIALSSASAGTYSQSSMLSNSAPNTSFVAIGYNLILPAFDSAQGTLTGVTVTIKGSLNGNILGNAGAGFTRGAAIKIATALAVYGPGIGHVLSTGPIAQVSQSSDGSTLPFTLPFMFTYDISSTSGYLSDFLTNATNLFSFSGGSGFRSPNDPSVFTGSSGDYGENGSLFGSSVTESFTFVSEPSSSSIMMGLLAFLGLGHLRARRRS